MVSGCSGEEALLLAMINLLETVWRAMVMVTTCSRVDSLGPNLRRASLLSSSAHENTN